MSEKLSTHSEVVLFGKIVEDLGIKGQKNSAAKDKAAFMSSARIYGYSFAREYFEMAGPTLFVVKGPGVKATTVEVPGPGLDDDDPFYKSLYAWVAEKSEQTRRLDMDSGTWEEILLTDPVDGGSGMSGARVSGARVSGARVSGARLSGARVSGARISGARLSGARDASD